MTHLRAVLTLSGLTALILVPFIAKAFHVDDVLFLYAARQILAHPLDFYGFAVNWYGVPDPVHEIMINPPVMCYALAMVAKVAGFNEIAMHAAFMMPAIGAVVGTYALARRCNARPVLAALIMLTTPVFVTCATTLMCDVLLLCFWIWAVVLWDCGMRDARHGAMFVAVLLISAAALTKYFGVALIPLLLLYSIVHQRRASVGLCWLLVPVVVLLAFHLWTDDQYGHSLVLDAIGYSGQYRSETSGRSLPISIVTGLSFTGGCFVSILFFLPFMVQGRAILMTALAAVVVGSMLVAITPLTPDGKIRWMFHLQFTAFVTTGMLILALAAWHLWVKRDSVAVVLCAWIYGTFTFACIINWSVTARTILPMAPAVAMLIVRQLELRNKRVAGTPRAMVFAPLVPAASLAMIVAWADFVFANSVRNAVDQIVPANQSRAGTIWFQGHWGFQYYMEQRGAKPFDLSNPGARAGDLIVLPKTNTNVFPLNDTSSMRYQQLDSPVVGWVTTMNAEAGAGFYSSAFGYLPYSFGKVQPEAYHLFELRSAQ